MTTKIGLISDVHAKSGPLKEALSIFRREDVDAVICAGDTAGYFDELESTIDLLVEHKCSTIIGNHDQAYLAAHPDETDSRLNRYLSALPEMLDIEIDGRRVYVVHAQPPASQHGGIKLLDVEGQLIDEAKIYWRQTLQDLEYDVLIVGHTHQVFVEQLGQVLVVNPGSTQFNHSCMILTLPDMRVETYALEGKPVLKSWNWGKFMQSQ